MNKFIDEEKVDRKIKEINGKLDVLLIGFTFDQRMKLSLGELTVMKIQHDIYHQELKGLQLIKEVLADE